LRILTKKQNKQGQNMQHKWCFWEQNLFHLHFDAWANSGDERAPERCCSKGEGHLKPDTITYSTVIHSFAKNGTPERA
jgi:hypothetical protein